MTDEDSVDVRPGGSVQVVRGSVVVPRVRNGMKARVRQPDPAPPAGGKSSASQAISQAKNAEAPGSMISKGPSWQGETTVRSA